MFKWFNLLGAIAENVQRILLLKKIQAQLYLLGASLMVYKTVSSS